MPKQRRDVLSEEEYTSTLSSIVQRDYFPDLPNLEKQAAVLTRRQLKDFKGAVAVRRAARQLQNHEDNLAEQEEIEENSLDGGNLRKRPRPLNRESIGGFHARATSEDNHEFEQNLQNELRAKKNRIEDVYRNSFPLLENGDMQRGSETPLLASDQFNAPNNNIKTHINPKLDNGFFFTPQLQNNQDDEGLETKLLKNNAGKSDMPPPLRVSKSDMKALKQHLIEYRPKNSLDKYIEPLQTRFATVKMIAFQKKTGNGDDFSTTDYSTDASTDLDAPVLPIYLESKKSARKKIKELDTLVAMTPLLEPRDDSSPITTWGVVSSTPLVVGGHNSILPPSFDFPDRSSREKAAKEVEEKIAKRRAKIPSIQRKTQNEVATPLMNRIASLTPAARSLFHRLAPPKKCSVRSSSAFANALRKSYTPKGRTSVSRDPVAQATPRATRRSEKFSNNQASRHVTDGLLNLS